MITKGLNLIFLLFIFSAHGALAQALESRKIVETLSSKKYWGRGYTKNGMKNAALFLEKEMKAIGLKPIISSGNYLQPFQFSANTFPNKMKVILNGKKLKPGKDYLVKASSAGFKGKWNSGDSAILFQKVAKLTWTPSSKVEPFTTIQYTDSTLVLERARIHIDQRFIPAFEAYNVVGMVEGTVYPDSFLVLTAHYDHLGGMGKQVYFPGANDNASGTAILMSLAQYYAQNPAKYSVVFMAFAAEEIGLKGSKYFVEHAPIPLPSIKFLLNLDLMGHGEDGICLVNGKTWNEASAFISSMNDKNQWFKQVQLRDNAPNSDHYPFTVKGVPAMFLYTMGGNGAYHDINDVAEGLPMSHGLQIHALVQSFFNSF